MTYVREPVLQPVSIESLRPTQITVGMREVEEKRKRLRKQKPQKIGSFIGRHMIPGVLGPKGRHYVIDHHHLSLALHKEGVEKVLVTVVADLPRSRWMTSGSSSTIAPGCIRMTRTASAAISRKSPNPSMIWWTIPSAASPASSAAP